MQKATVQRAEYHVPRHARTDGTLLARNAFMFRRTSSTIIAQRRRQRRYAFCAIVKERAKTR